MSVELSGKAAWTVQVFTNSTDARLESYAKNTETDYPQWLELYHQYGRDLLPMAEITAIGKDAVARIRDKAGNCAEIALSGPNFLHATIGNVQFEILKIVYGGLPPNVDPAPGDEAMISMFVRTSRFPEKQMAAQFTKLMQERLRQKRVNVAFREDAFFIDSLWFPILYRFDVAPTPPTFVQYQLSKTIYCFGEETGQGCR
jgi:hypothetical protein